VAVQTYQLTFDGAAADMDVYGDVASLWVEESSDAPSAMKLRLHSTRAPDGSWSYLEAERFALFSKVAVQIGFTGAGGGRLPTVFAGYITDVQLEFGSEPGQSFVEVTAIDACVLMSLEEKISSWPNLTDSDIVRQIVGSYGLPLTADSTATVHQESDTTVTQRGTDIRFVRDLAHRNGFEFYFEPGVSGDVTAFFRAPQLGGVAQPDLAIQFGASGNLHRFSARLTGQRPLTVSTQQLDVKSNSTNSAKAETMQLTALGARDVNALVRGQLNGLVKPKGADAQMLVLGSPTSDSTELRTLAQAVRDEAAWFITASGEVNTDAYQNVLRPRKLVLVKGAGRQYSGRYYVTRVVHEITMEGLYVQRFEARRNARDLQGGEPFSSGDGA
jgi:phage protein D